MRDGVDGITFGRGMLTPTGTKEPGGCTYVDVGGVAKAMHAHSAPKILRCTSSTSLLAHHARDNFCLALKLLSQLFNHPDAK